MCRCDIIGGVLGRSCFVHVLGYMGFWVWCIDRNWGIGDSANGRMAIGDCRFWFGKWWGTAFEGARGNGRVPGGVLREHCRARQKRS